MPAAKAPAITWCRPDESVVACHEKIKVLNRIRVVKAEPEALGDMLLRPDGGHSELAKEGFPFGHRDPKEFVYALARKSGKALTDQIMRIEFEYLDEQEST